MILNNCYHCGQHIEKGELVLQSIKGVEHSFCCHGCAGVCDAIHEAGMESFYKRTIEGDLLSPPPPPSKDATFFDYDEVQAQYVSKLTSKREITLISEAIHCAACIWLIEHTLAKMDGVLLAKVNFTNKQIKLRWDNDKIKLSEIIQKLNKVGYDATPYDASASQKAFRKANRDLLYRLGFAGFAMMNVMWFSVALYTGADQESLFRNYFHWIEFIIATTVILYSAKPFFQGAMTSLKSRTIGMDVSISLGVITTYLYSFWVTIDSSHPGEVYFDTMVDFIFLLLIGRYIEAISKNKAVDATRRLVELQPKVARLKTEDGFEVVSVTRLKKKDLVIVKPGDQIPVDGLVISGTGNVDEAMLSGESTEVFKQEGTKVSAGTINIDGSLTIEVDAIMQETMLGKIVEMVEEAQGAKASIQCTAERIMPWFVTVIISLSVLSFLYWIVEANLETAMIAATSVLIITCPCAFGLATPMATAVASGVSASHGILIKNGALLEVLNEVNHFVFDKTGTLTKGQMKLVDSHVVEGIEDKDALLKDIYRVEFHSEHSLAKAVCQSLHSMYSDLANKNLELDFFQAHPGRGVEARYHGQHYLLGTATWLKQYDIEMPDIFVSLEAERAEKGQTSVWVALDNKIVAILFLEDELRPDALELISRLKEKGKSVTLLSGDRYAVAKTVAEKLGGMEVIAEVLPEDKHEKIKQIQASGSRVAMVGDGINDAPALVRSDVGFALGSGTDISMDSADIVLLNNELISIDTAVELSARTLRTIKQNIASSIIYNFTLVPLAMAATLTPLIAAVTMPLSSLIVIGNAARIRTFFSKRAIAKRKRRRQEAM
ncbi:heavy metal translocating P-type ATPase [Hydrogenovibrio kuenenii]|uniref:heavy metal translocating P-type ATPase n=1 Tax=Hydrogenovibrio kuenenii TaxID=63658 RepID=UPI000466F7A9|nr:heavy metal translocating P-type ATPase [Hydrogenovibrio kuenenii]